ncbi:MAG: hypothetical protein ACSLE6_01390 [Mycobacterium sp.]
MSRPNSWLCGALVGPVFLVVDVVVVREFGGMDWMLYAGRSMEAK